MLNFVNTIHSFVLSDTFENNENAKIETGCMLPENHKSCIIHILWLITEHVGRTGELSENQQHSFAQVSFDVLM